MAIIASLAALVFAALTLWSCFGDARLVPAEVSTPVCEGSLVADRGVLYFSHPQSETTRTNLTIHRSEDNGTGESF